MSTDDRNPSAPAEVVLDPSVGATLVDLWSSASLPLDTASADDNAPAPDAASAPAGDPPSP